MKQEQADELVDVKRAARRVGISASTLNKQRVYGGGPRFTKLGGSVRYRISDLDAWVSENIRTSTTAG